MRKNKKNIILLMVLIFINSYPISQEIRQSDEKSFNQINNINTPLKQIWCYCEQGEYEKARQELGKIQRTNIRYTFENEYVSIQLFELMVIGEILNKKGKIYLKSREKYKKHLVFILNDLPKTYKYFAIKIIGDIKDKTNWKLLLPFLNSKDNIMMLYTIRALEKLKSTESVPYLIKLYKKKSNYWQIKAVIAKIGGENAKKFFLKKYSKSKTKEKIIEYLYDILEIPDLTKKDVEKIKIKGIETKLIKDYLLYKFGDSNKLAEIEKFLDSEDIYLKTLSINLLGRVNDSKIRDKLIKYLNDSNYEIRAEVVNILAIIKTEENYNLIKKMLYDRNSEVVRIAIYSLLGYEDKEFTTLKEFKDLKKGENEPKIQEILDFQIQQLQKKLKKEGKTNENDEKKH